MNASSNGERKDLQIDCTSCYPSAFLQTMGGFPIFRLAEHKVLCMIHVELRQEIPLLDVSLPLNSLQYAPTKNAALFKGALVAPTSLTFGIEEGRGAGSRKG
jgi:hypothetical protein